MPPPEMSGAAGRRKADRRLLSVKEAFLPFFTGGRTSPAAGTAQPTNSFCILYASAIFVVDFSCI
jgi:hypothetical protein